jgi:SM-20-related protein
MNEKFESLIQGLIDDQFGFCKDFFDEKLIQGLSGNLIKSLVDGSMVEAGVGRKFTYAKNAQVRGDVIKWIDNESKDPFEKEFIKIIKDFISYLNDTCYVGINDFEFHYACYEPGSFYKRHKDQFHSDHGRKYSVVSYLNIGWVETDGGALTLYLPENDITVKPNAGNIVLFKSDELEHEVQPAFKRRLSIAGWLKRI